MHAPMISTSAAPLHGARQLPSVTVESYNLELHESGTGFVGDRANDEAFAGILERFRRACAEGADDPLGHRAGGEFGTRDLEELLDDGGPPRIAALVDETIDEFAHELLHVIARFRSAAPGWETVERVVIGGGLGASRVGRRIVERLEMRSGKMDALPIEQLSHGGDEAGLIGGAHLPPREVLAQADALLAVDIGGSKLRAGLVDPHLARASDLSAAAVCEKEVWRHADADVGRDEVVARLAGMLGALAERASLRHLSLAPMVAVACPGLIDENGFIKRGAQNLPGHWEGDGFNLPRAIEALFGTGFSVIMHNDAVVQGLSQRPSMGGGRRWAILTIGTGLGNACFTNR
jgi:predicted NBD/HSP70 family sugar kinase